MVSQKRKAVTKFPWNMFKKSKTGSKKAEAIYIDHDDNMNVIAIEDKSNPKESQAKIEKEIVAVRKSELKAMLVDDLKDLLVARGLETGKKEDMISALALFEAKARAAVRQHESNVRGVVVSKKEELEALSVPELRELCDSMGIKGVLTKHARIEQFLTLWQENKGVDKALAKVAHDLREGQLCAMDRSSLRKFCDKLGVSPFVKDVMIERILRGETVAGRFSRPTLEQVEEEQESAPGKKGDMVDALLAMEASRKKSADLKARQVEEAARKREELRSMNMEQLKKFLQSKGMEAAGKKEDVVEALFGVGVQEDAMSARKTKLRSLSMDDLKKLCLRRRLTQEGKRDDMVEAILAHEAKSRQEVQAYAAKMLEVLAKKKEELEAKTNAELKELLASKGFAVGRAKEDWVESLLTEAKDSGEVDALLAVLSREARRGILLSIDELSLQKLCDDLVIDPYVKEVMVERIIARENEVGAKPVVKSARTPKK